MRIRRGMRTAPDRFESSWTPEANTGCWLWMKRPHPTTGRPRFSIGAKVGFAYRYSWEINRGPIPEGLCVCHKCDTPMCVNPEHLFLGTYNDNHRDMRQKGRSYVARGEGNGRSKLSCSSVRAIREALKSGTTRKQLAETYGVTSRTIGHIHNNQIWQSPDLSAPRSPMPSATTSKLTN